TRNYGRQTLEVRGHDSEVIARDGFDLELTRQSRPRRSWIGREVCGNCRPGKVYFTGVETRPITFQCHIGAVAEALQRGRGRDVERGLIRRAETEPLQSSGDPSPCLPAPQAG